MANPSSDAAMWLNTLSKQTKDTIPLFYTEYRAINKLTPLNVVRTINSKAGEAEIFFIDRKQTIQSLKNLYAFHTQQEAREQLHRSLES